MKKRLLIILWVFACFILWAKPTPINVYGYQKMEIQQEISLEALFDSSIPSTQAALIIGADSIAVGVTADEFDKINFKYKQKKWYVVSDSLPEPVNIRNVSSIYLYYPFKPRSTTEPNESNFQDIREQADFLGQAEKNGYRVWKYHVHRGVDK